MSPDPHDPAIRDATGTSPTGACRICGSSALKPLILREMMFGTRRSFDYVECTSCGCIQIARYPADIGAHYPGDYYSFQDDAVLAGSLVASTKARLKSVALGIPALQKRWIASAGIQRWLATRPDATATVEHASGPATRILDVGCGAGQLLRMLDWLGFHRLEGVDPFVQADIQHRGRILVRKRSLADVDGSFDLVMLHHALEHMPDQPEVMRNLRRLLAPGGKALIRIPVTGGKAWRKYPENWVQLDAPRHYYVHSRDSIRLLAERSGLRLSSIADDSTDFQFWASELYSRDISLREANTAPCTPRSHFTPQDWEHFHQQAGTANRESDGDQIVAVFEAA